MHSDFQDSVTIMVVYDKIINCIHLQDFSKALDEVYHSLLLGKIEKCGIDSITTQLIHNWLTKEIQHIVLNEATSMLKETCSGVP